MMKMMKIMIMMIEEPLQWPHEKYCHPPSVNHERSSTPRSWSGRSVEEPLKYHINPHGRWVGEFANDNLDS